ncbi:ABC transporter substrate-binding protein [Microbacterium sp. KSW4-16]|uniref:ABC transporter substrate-binding protein n=1 Tax=Microbacterium TaxID=33882 RepID=UPI001069A070|nr:MULTISPECIES: ABC transporter substrate-binding protein [Microbacterium]MCK8467519.1 ABC transporter substrate-binding protein [Microbacterium aurugineum]QEA28115.1 peptide ABC transporter substrate-binding protein [Microbacterium sp. CBA3102]TFB16642.1 peptide ABC transporter substrate-binding protein [Microbacterium sp. 3H14]UUE20834.1 ABC transporter substrate-binding protein [Microbacterium sp. J1-1]
MSKSLLRTAVPASRRVLIAALTVTALVGSLAACAPSSATPEPSEVAVVDGGELVIGAEQEPDCTDWIATCAGSIWGTYVMQVPTMPAVFQTRQVDEEWVPVPSDLVTEEPVAEVAADGTQTITYSINPEAVWSDGEPITSADFAYTALQIRDGDDIFDKTGYDRITAVDTSDPQTAVVTLDSAYAGWRTLFSVYGIMPSHLLEGQDRAALMTDGYDFSGGPWKIEKWTRGTSVTLVPNENYWGEKPHLDRVTFLFLPDTTAAFQALKSGQVSALYPSPQLDALTQIEAGLPGIRSQVDARSGNLEAIWLNNAAAPFDSVAVRQALAYSIDRDAIVKRLFGSLGIEEAQQSFNSPMVAPFAADDFSRYTLDLDKVDELMEGDGWSKNSDDVWAKDGETATFAVKTLAGNKRRDLTVQVLQSQLADAGFEMTIDQVTPADLFGTTAPQGDFQAGLWALVDTFPDPTLSSTFSSVNIPSEANGYSGINFYRVDIPGLDDLLGQVDSEIDTDARIAASHEGDALIAENVPSLPLDTVPNVLLWSETVGGPLQINPVEGPFWNLAEWGLAG